MLMQSKPTSRINSAIKMLSHSDSDAVVYLNKAVIIAGELIVMTVAVRTVSHAERRRSLATASRSMFWNRSRICSDAETQCERLCAESISDRRSIDSLDMLCAKKKRYFEKDTNEMLQMSPRKPMHPLPVPDITTGSSLYNCLRIPN
jgi:hypothetical protein